MATNIYKLVVTPEVDFKKKQMNSNVFEVAVSKLEEDDVVKEFLTKSFNATDFNLTTANRILYDRTGDIPSTELPNYSPFSFHYIVRDHDIISFKIPKEEGSYLAYYKEDLVSESLLEFN